MERMDGLEYSHGWMALRFKSIIISGSFHHHHATPVWCLFWQSDSVALHFPFFLFLCIFFKVLWRCAVMGLDFQPAVGLSLPSRIPTL